MGVMLNVGKLNSNKKIKNKNKKIKINFMKNCILSFIIKETQLVLCFVKIIGKDMCEEIYTLIKISYIYEFIHTFICVYRWNLYVKYVK